MSVHPLIFEPILIPKVWGGRALAEQLGKTLPADIAVGESLELADLPGIVSVVREGPMRGKTLAQLVELWGHDLVGRAGLVDGRFPLLLKYLDVREPLSVQVHPGRRAAAERNQSGDVKHEAWYIIDAASDAVIYRGLRDGVDDATLRAACGNKSIVPMMNALSARRGNCHYCPGGTVHALGAGLLIAEVQTPSNVTYRLFDWDRTRPAGDDGLQIEDSLAVLERLPSTAFAQQRSHTGGLFTTVTRMCDCEAFRIEKVRFSEGIEQDIPYAELVIWMVLDGSGEVRYGNNLSLAFHRGDTVVLPAALAKGRLKTLSDCTWLEITIPMPSDLAEFGRPSAEELQRPDAPTTGFVSLGVPRHNKNNRESGE